MQGADNAPLTINPCSLVKTLIDCYENKELSRIELARAYETLIPHVNSCRQCTLAIEFSKLFQEYLGKVDNKSDQAPPES
jgi:hypothetical protein